MDPSSTDGDGDFFSEFIEAVDRRDVAKIAAIIAAHPEHAPALNELRRGAESTHEGSDPQPTPFSRAPSCWDEFIARIRELGCNHARYESKKTIGRGGIGLVLEVFDTVGKRTLAMKVLRDQFETSNRTVSQVDDRKLGRFIEESQITGQLDHPGIVPVHEIGIDPQGRVYFTMKRVRGISLHEVFARVRSKRDGWTVTRVVGVLQRVCEAMTYAHVKGVIHRDLKPANVMVGAFGEMYVMDWGLARILDSSEQRVFRGDESTTLTSVRQTHSAGSSSGSLATLDGEIVGTPAYMPPEQAGGDLERVGRSADVYAIGAMLYELLAGHAPYANIASGKRPMDVIHAVLGGPPTPLQDIATTAPPELIAIATKAMARSAVDRYGSMELLADDLRAYLENRVVKAYKTGAWVELKQWIRRNRALSATAGLGILASFALTTVALVESRRATNEAIRADANAAAVIARSADILRLADERRLDRLAERHATLRSPRPENIRELQRWLDEFDDVARRGPDYETTLSALLAKATGAPGAEKFASEEDERYASELRELFGKLDSLRRDDPYGVTRRAIADRLAIAKDLHRISIDEHAAEWSQAIEAIADRTISPKYGGLRITAQIGLVPLGQDAASGLYEFCDVISGEPPVRDPKTARWQMAAGTGVVLVLLPGGRFFQGAQKSDKNEPNYDPDAADEECAGGRAIEVELAPFFISKYEMTQEQWRRLEGRSPTFFVGQYASKTSPVHPADSISQAAAMELLPAYLLELPTEAQWEYACRAGTQTEWSFGNDFAIADRFCNVKDAAFRRGMANVAANEVEAIDDNETLAAPVGRYAPNAFGLFDMHGNLMEWCKDRYAPSYSGAVHEGDGEQIGAKGGTYIARGGAFSLRRIQCRSGFRFAAESNFSSYSQGIRPARPLDRLP